MSLPVVSKEVRSNCLLSEKSIYEKYNSIKKENPEVHNVIENYAAMSELFVPNSSWFLITLSTAVYQMLKDQDAKNSENIS